MIASMTPGTLEARSLSSQSSSPAPGRSLISAARPSIGILVAARGQHVHRVGRDAQPPVLDLDHVAVGHPAAPDLDTRAGRGVEHGVLDQLREDVRHIRDRRALHEVRRVRQHVNPGIVLDLTGRAAQRYSLTRDA
jgi:hypothetical protein